ncbi:PREDICTED: acyltransferase-like protein At3g26840, chloroplastic [Populus euphratica]|uniref:Acyltransferase-like protein At3g26840, chloroplastic n=1 Tax=Populus euphratica TaxID=75702 RepID=A0AAJ6Y8B0_POPEU|nr:PREDICTED: acyltransferase-like protein At3g26840, chloroplastic [Populus euphratica]
MAATGGCVAFSTVVRSCQLTPSPSSGNLRPNPSQRQFAVSSESQFTTTVRSETKRTTSFGENGIFKEKHKEEAREGVTKEKQKNPYELGFERNESDEDRSRKSLKDYFEESNDLIRSGGGGGGPPRWFSPLDCGSRLDDSPLLLYLPGIDGVGLGLIMHHQSLGEIFDIWCLHIPVKDRTSFTDLVKLVEQTVRSENCHSSNRPIYLVGESLGACLALAVAVRNPDIDLSLILANPGTSFEKSQLQPLIPLLGIIPVQYQLSLSYMLSSMTGDPLRMAMDKVMKGLPLQQTAEGLLKDVAAMPSYVYVLANILPEETLLWKLKMLKSASAFANSRLHAVKAQTLLLTSGRDQLLPSEDEGKRLRRALPKCEIRRFNDNGHYLFLEDGVDLVTVIKGASFYRRGKCHDYAFDYIPPTPTEFKNLCESNRLFMHATSPVMLSTLEDGKIVKGLAGIPSEGPVLFIGYHMLLGCELVPMVVHLLLERNIIMRGMAHPMMFMRKKEGNLPELSSFDTYRIMGAVPVSGINLYKLLSSKAHVLLYPGGLREACHRKGEQYKLIWPEQSEFVRMAARFGAKIVPFGVAGEDDFGEIVFDYDDQMKIPFLRDFIKSLSEEADTVRTGLNSEVNQDVHSPVVLPKFPGRFYYYFGKPIETEGRMSELRDKDNAHELYVQVKSEVEKCLAFLQEKRESDPYRNLLARLAYQSTHGFDSEVPTFEL